LILSFRIINVYLYTASWLKDPGIPKILVTSRWKSVDSPLCEVCNVEEDVRHILMYCKKYERQRLPLKKACLKYFGAFTLSSILGHAQAPPWARKKLRSILGHAQAPPWARKKSVEVLGRFIVDTKLHLEL
jgi:hypothetical protein